MEEDVNEAELCMHFVGPFLTGRFDDLNNAVYLRWTNETTLEAKQNDDAQSVLPGHAVSSRASIMDMVKRSQLCEAISILTNCDIACWKYCIFPLFFCKQ